MRSTTSTVLLALILIFTFPIWIGLAGAVFGVFVGVIGAVFGVFGGVIGSIAGLFGSLFGWIFDWSDHHFFPFSFPRIFIVAAVILVIVLVSRSRKRAS